MLRNRGACPSVRRGDRRHSPPIARSSLPSATRRTRALAREREQRSDVRLSDFVVETVCTLIGLLEQAIYLSRYASLTTSREISCHVSASLLQPLGRRLAGCLGRSGPATLKLECCRHHHIHTLIQHGTGCWLSCTRTRWCPSRQRTQRSLAFLLAPGPQSTPTIRSCETQATSRAYTTTRPSYRDRERVGGAIVVGRQRQQASEVPVDHAHDRDHQAA